jgi:hypothetical protein
MFCRYSDSMRILLPGIIVFALLAFGNAAHAVLQDTPAACSIWLATHPEGSGGVHRRACVLAVAGTYIDAEENSLPFDKALLSDDVSRHRIGTDPVFAPGNRAKLIAIDTHDVIAAIKNRRWTVEGDTAWILYDGYLKKDPDKIGFYVAERITLKKGLIHEILVADITVPK